MVEVDHHWQELVLRCVCSRGYVEGSLQDRRAGRGSPEQWVEGSNL